MRQQTCSVFISCLIILLASSVCRAAVPWPEEFVPPETKALAYINVKSVLESKFFAEITDGGKAEWFTKFREGMKKNTGLDLNEVHDFTAVFTFRDIVRRGPTHFALIFRFPEAVDQMAVRKAHTKDDPPTDTIGGIDLYTRNDVGLAFPDAKTVIIGISNFVPEVLKQKADGKVAKLDEKLQAALDKADTTLPVIAAGLWPEEVRNEIAKEIKQQCDRGLRRGTITSERFWEFATLSIPMRWGLSAEGASVTFDPDGKKGLMLLMMFSDEESAAQIAAFGQALSRPVAFGLEHMDVMGEEERKAVAEHVIEEMDNVKPLYSVVADGKTALLTMDSPTLTAAIKDIVRKAEAEAGRVRSMANLRQIAMACQMYATDHNGALPPDFDAMMPYLGNRKVLENPRLAKHDPISDYEYIGAGANLNQIPNAGQTVIAFERLEKVDAKNLPLAAFADGHVRQLTMDEYEALMKLLDAARRK